MTVSISGTSGLVFNDASTQNTSAFTGGFAFRNRIINGGMVIDQRNAGASVTANDGVYFADRWKLNATQNGKGTIQQNQGSVTPPAGFSNYIGFTSNSAYSVLSTDTISLVQNIEGLNVADLAWGTASAATVTLSFWVRSSLTGTFGGALENNAVNRSYPFTYTISSANTWEQKTITIVGDTSGTWLTTNGLGIRVWINIGTGSNYNGTAGSWAGADYRSATGATSVVGTNGATFYITGVQLEKGSTATSFDYRPYGTELALCQRYYYRMQAAGANSFFGSGFNQSTTIQQTLTVFPVPLRTAPSALEQSGTAGDYRINNLNTSTACSVVPVWNGADTFSARTEMQVASGLTAGQGSLGRALNSNAYLAWSAEL